MSNRYHIPGIDPDTLRKLAADDRGWHTEDVGPYCPNKVQSVRDMNREYRLILDSHLGKSAEELRLPPDHAFQRVVRGRDRLRIPFWRRLLRRLRGIA